MPSDYFGDRVC